MPGQCDVYRAAPTIPALAQQKPCGIIVGLIHFKPQAARLHSRKPCLLSDNQLRHLLDLRGVFHREPNIQIKIERDSTPPRNKNMPHDEEDSIQFSPGTLAGGS